MLHTIKTQDECDLVVHLLRTTESQSHIIYIYAHGSDKQDMSDVLKSMGGKYLFIDELAATIREVMEEGKNVYIIANSCHWNLKYERGFPTPTISFGPDKSTRLPFASEHIERKLAALPDEFDKPFFLGWVTNLQTEYTRHANVFECYDEKGNTIDVEEFRIIEV